MAGSVDMQKPTCLLIHGFTGGTYELTPLAERLSSCGVHCRLPLLPWNGERLPQANRVYWPHWVAAAEEEARQLAAEAKSFDIVGFSMGGLIAAYLANRYPVRRLVLLNASVIYISPRHFIREFTERIRQGDRGTLHKMRGTPLQAAWQFTRLVRHLKPELPKVNVPTLIAQSSKDSVIHPRSARYIYGKLSGPKELRYFPNSGHLICLGPDAAELFTQVEQFLAL